MRCEAALEDEQRRTRHVERQRRTRHRQIHLVLDRKSSRYTHSRQTHLRIRMKCIVKRTFDMKNDGWHGGEDHVCHPKHEQETQDACGIARMRAFAAREVVVVRFGGDAVLCLLLNMRIHVSYEPTTKTSTVATRAMHARGALVPQEVRASIEGRAWIIFICIQLHQPFAFASVNRSTFGPLLSPSLLDIGTDDFTLTACYLVSLCRNLGMDRPTTSSFLRYAMHDSLGFSSFFSSTSSSTNTLNFPQTSVTILSKSLSRTKLRCPPPFVVKIFGAT